MTDEVRRLRPRLRHAWHLFATLAAILWSHNLVVGLVLYWEWPDHPALHGPSRQLLIGSGALTFLLCGGPALMFWTIFGPCAWRVGPTGIETWRRGRPRWALPWGDITEVRIFFRYVVVRTPRHRSGLELGCLDRADVRWFDDYATARLGDRVGRLWPRPRHAATNPLESRART